MLKIARQNLRFKIHEGAKGVECADGQRVAAGAHQSLQPVPHLPGRFVGKCYRQKAVRANAAHSDHVGNPMSNDPGLAAAWPSDDQHRAIDSFDGFLLRGVEPFEYL